MAIAKYLEKYRSALAKTQGQQVLKTLLGKKDSGEIRNLDEFKDRLKKLTTELLSNKIRPTFRLWPAIPGEEISSEQYNDMLERIHNDLETAFREANTIDEVLAAHCELINNVSLKVLRYATNNIESQVELYEFIEKNPHGFDDCLFRTFRDSEGVATNRFDKNAAILFVDPRTKQTVSASYDAAVDYVGERVLLPATENSYVQIRSARQVPTSGMRFSEVDVQFSTSSIDNILDGTNGTYWAYPVLLSSPSTTGCSVKIELDFGNVQDVNFLDIEPASHFPMALVSISYYDANQDLYSLYTTETILKRPIRIHFSRVTAQRLVIELRQDNFRELQCQFKPGESIIYKAISGSDPAGTDISAELQAATTSSFVLEDAFHVKTSIVPLRKFYEYLIGIDNVRAGICSFQDKGIYVSVPKVVTEPGLLSLRTIEKRPYIDQTTSTAYFSDYTYPVRTDTEDAKCYSGSTEFWVVACFRDSAGYLISTDQIPVLPLGASRVYHEQLPLWKITDSSFTRANAGSLMFFAQADWGDVLVYRNGALLTHGTDWIFSVDADLTQTDPTADTRMLRGIELVEEPQTLDIYTVSYTPTLSTAQFVPTTESLLKTVSLRGSSSIRLVANNVIAIDKQIGSYQVASADMYLVAIFRSNTANVDVSPAVEEFMLVTGSRDTGKFDKDY